MFSTCGFIKYAEFGDLCFLYKCQPKVILLRDLCNLWRLKIKIQEPFYVGIIRKKFGGTQVSPTCPFFFFLILTQRCVSLILEKGEERREREAREGGREGEKEGKGGKGKHRLPSICTPTRDRIHKPGMCPNQKLWDHLVHETMLN